MNTVYPPTIRAWQISRIFASHDALRAVFFDVIQSTDVINGDVKRAILERMLDVLKVQPKELNHELQNVQPIGQHKVTSNAIGWYHDKHVSISQRADTYARSVGRLDK